MTENNNNSGFYLNEYNLTNVLSYLSLEQKIGLSFVSKHFSECVNHLLKSQKVLKIYLSRYALDERLKIETDFVIIKLNSIRSINEVKL